ncbi:POK18 protein, partial [Steatornis caripensis]|nr:POK18 protein [Steatornis caripensis]
ICHSTGIPHSPTGQAIVEWAHHTLKEYLAKQKEGEGQYKTPQNRLYKVIHMLNHLTLHSPHDDNPPIVKHFATMQAALTSIARDGTALVIMRNLQTGLWEGP